MTISDVFKATVKRAESKLPLPPYGHVWRDSNLYFT